MAKKVLGVACVFFLVVAVSAKERSLVWVFFADKGFDSKAAYGDALEVARRSLNHEALERREKALGTQDAVGWRDLPVCRSYVEEIERMGGSHRVSFSWLNCASFDMPRDRVDAVSALPFVKSVRPVAVGRVSVPRFEDSARRREVTKSPQEMIYGLSELQLRMMRIPEAHAQAYTGAGVRIGILDSGYELRHKAFQQLHVVGEHDFISGEWLWFDGTISPHNYYQVEGIEAGEDASGNVHVVFEVSDSMLNQEIYYTQTMDDGMTWSDPINMSENEYGRSLDPSLLISGGSVLAAWHAFDPGRSWGLHEDVFVRFASSDSIVNVSTDILPSLWPALAGRGGDYRIVWVTADSVFCAHSTDGYAWTRDTTHVFGSSVGGLALATPSDLQLLVFATDGDNRLILVESADGGATWQRDTLASSAESPRVTVSGGVVHLAYRDRSSFPLYNITYRNSTDWSQSVDLFSMPRSAIGRVSIGSTVDSVWVTYEERGYVCRSGWSAPSMPVSPVVPDTLTPSGFAYSPALIESGRVLWKTCGDDTTRDQTGDVEGQQYHGTGMLSLIGGYAPAQLYGAAFNAEFVLAKTEKIKTLDEVDFEMEVEEDWWVKGVEWAEGLGVDIISSSLGYRFVGWDELDGNTAVTTRAADIAAHLGVLVVNAVGNRTALVPTPVDAFVAPADGDSVLSVGATDTSGNYYSGYIYGSAYGPLIDGRDKPEVATYPEARIAHWKPRPGQPAGQPPDSFSFSVGTSCATALTAGLCALVMEANPERTNHEVREAVMHTSSLSPTVDSDTMAFGQTPNDSLGWGVPDVMRAMEYWGVPPVPPRPTEGVVKIYPNPLVYDAAGENAVTFEYVLMNHAMPRLRIYTLSGRLVEEVEDSERTPGRYEIRWVPPSNLSSGVYIGTFLTGFSTSSQKFAIVR